MYKFVGLAFCAIIGISIAIFGWTSLLWSPLGFIIGLFFSANIFLPLLMGIPVATSHVTKSEMRSGVYLSLFRAPMFWTAPILVLFVFFPSAIQWITSNQPLYLGLIVGFVAILLSPLSSKGRQDFRSDFDKSYGRYYTNNKNFTFNYTNPKDKRQLKEVEAVIQIASNQYLHTFLNSTDTLNLQSNDAKFRCLAFCLTSTIQACKEAIDNYEIVQDECLHFLATIITDKKSSREFFTLPLIQEEAEHIGKNYIKEFEKNWQQYNNAISNNQQSISNNILCSMLHYIESDEPLNDSDEERLQQLCWELGFSFTHGTMKSAFVSLMEK